MLNLILFIATYVAGFLLTFRNLPILSFVTYQSVYFFNPTARWWGTSLPDISYSFFTVALMFYAYISHFKAHNLNKFWSIPQLRYFFLLVALFYITGSYAIFPEIHERAFIDYIKMLIIIYLAFKLCDTDKKFDLILYGYIFGAWYISFLTYQAGRNAGDRVEGIGTVDAPDSNGIAAAIAPCLVVCFYYFWIAKKNYQRVLFAFAGVFIANALMLINSRGAFLAAIVGILYFMWNLFFSSVQRKHQKKMSILVIIIGLSGVVSLADESFIHRLKSISSTAENIDNTEEETGATRVQFWLATMDMVKDYPFGKGARAFEYFGPFYIPDDVNTGNSRNRAVHSTWFEVLSEVGYLGLTLFSLMFFYAFKTLRLCKKSIKEAENFNQYFKIVMLQSILWSFIVAMSFLNRMRAEVLYWFILYTACAYNIYIIQKQTKPDKK